MKGISHVKKIKPIKWNQWAGVMHFAGLPSLPYAFCPKQSLLATKSN
jgi:hypothetical protein